MVKRIDVPVKNLKYNAYTHTFFFFLTVLCFWLLLKYAVVNDHKL